MIVQGRQITEEELAAGRAAMRGEFSREDVAFALARAGVPDIAYSKTKRSNETAGRLIRRAKRSGEVRYLGNGIWQKIRLADRHIWEDVTSYGRPGTERARGSLAPHAFATRVGGIRVVVTRGHIDYRGRWICRCAPLFDYVELEVETADDAKESALEHLQAWLDHMQAALNGMELPLQEPSEPK